MEDKITIDKDTLKAIASDTRLDILKRLDQKKQTLSDLSKSLKLSGPTIKEHLEVLGNAGLVRKEDSLRKWKYYSLTFKGRGLLRPNETKLFLTLLITIVFGLGVFILLGFFYGIGSSSRMANNSAFEITANQLSDNAAITSGESLEKEVIESQIVSQSTAVDKNNLMNTYAPVSSNNENTTQEQTTVITNTSNNENVLFGRNYPLILAIVILTIYVIFIIYVNEKKKRKNQKIKYY